MRHAAPPAVYVALVALSQFATNLVFTANIVYQVESAGLTPLQLVLVGTVWEATYFLFEVPTGVVSDLYSRRLSVIIGLFISGLGLALVGAFPVFETIIVGHVVLGIGGTFVSGAQEAWVADEVGAASAGDVFLRGSQYGRFAGLLAIPLSVGLGSIDLQVPQFAGAGVTALTGIAMVFLMKETAFHPLRSGEGHGLAAMLRPLREARALVRRRPVLLTVLAVFAVFGAASEGFDRLATPHFLRDTGLPSVGHFDPIVWYGVIAGLQTLLGIAIIQRVRRQVDTTDHAALGRAMMASDVLRSAGVVAFAFCGSFWLALAVYLPSRAFALMHYPLSQAWINLSLESSVRATMLSVASQCDALGQISAGPLVGLLADATSVRTGLTAAGLALLPVVPLYSRAIGQGDGVMAPQPAPE
jgi:DHA3 family tetracycline resistance protein-like MFS transporter